MLRTGIIAADISLTHSILHKLCELSCIVPAVYDILEQVFLLHGPELLVGVLLFVEAAAGHRNSIRVCVPLLLLLKLLGFTLSPCWVAATVTRLFNHVCDSSVFCAL